MSDRPNTTVPSTNNNHEDEQSSRDSLFETEQAEYRKKRKLCTSMETQMDTAGNSIQLNLQYAQAQGLRNEIVHNLVDRHNIVQDTAYVLGELMNKEDEANQKRQMLKKPPDSVLDKWLNDGESPDEEQPDESNHEEKSDESDQEEESHEQKDDLAGNSNSNSNASATVVANTPTSRQDED